MMLLPYTNTQLHTYTHDEYIYKYIHTCKPPQGLSHAHKHAHTTRENNTLFIERMRWWRRRGRRTTSPVGTATQHPRCHEAQRKRSVRYRSKHSVDSFWDVFLSSSFSLPPSPSLPFSHSLCSVWDAHTLTYIGKTAVCEIACVCVWLAASGL